MSSKVFIPHDLVLDVLSWLPVKSLVRFKCVSKSWCGVIDNPDFIKTHLKKSKSNMKVIAEAVTIGGPKLYDVGFILSEISNLKEIKYPIIMGDSGITIAGTCNGLICLVYSNFKEDGRIDLWNPSTQKHLRLPICSNQYRKTYGYSLHGFGYDEITDDYKVVRLVRYGASFEFCIFSLKSNKWRSLGDFAYGRDLNWWICEEGLLANGVLYWVRKDNSILAFDLGTEGFQVLPPPPETSIKLPYLSVAFLSGFQQHLIFNNYDGGEKWIMKDKIVSIKDCWTKLTFEDLSTGIQLLIMRPWSDFSNIEIYNLEKQSFENVDFPLKVEYRRSCVYFESLVRLDASIEAQNELEQ